MVRSYPFRFVLAAVLGMAVSQLAVAQAPAARPASPGLGGPVIPGVCFLSREAVLANSKVAVYASSRIKQITADAQAEIDRERKPLEDQLTALRAQASKLPADQLRAQEKALGEKFAPIQAKAELRKREIEKTRANALETISEQAQPQIAAVYTQKSCGVLFDRNMALGGNFTNDLTPAVVAALDGRLTSIPIERVTLAPGKP
ncbi:MAG: outer membrane chaperone Skp [Novosphingobium sp. 12-64-8]|nr:MAG: outer membrane chaperone Skp [Novosphingobium sp. 12-64-8]